MAWPGLLVPLAGRRVTLEPLVQRHAAALEKAGREPEVWRWMPVDGSRPEVFAHAFAQALELAERGDSGPFAVVVDGEPVGSTRYLALRPEHRGLEIGYTWYRRDLWGSGVNVEAKLLLLEHAFERLGCLRVEFKTDARNERSRAALAALPARFEGVFRKHMVVRDGDLRDSAYYSIVDDEWPEVRANLEARLRARA
jgi:RimJ/RimL family protein N-acetyltransferase